MIRRANPSDATAIADIYNHYINNTVITFEEEPVCGDKIQERITNVLQSDLPWLVAQDESKRIIGYAYATKWRERFSYRFSVEITVYLDPNESGKGTGSKLYSALFAELKQRSIHCVIGGITLPNPASVALHEKFGLEQVAHFKEVGYKFNQWLDVGYWQGKIKN